MSRVAPATYVFGARHLPASNVPWSFGAKRIRARLAGRFLTAVHPPANIEPGCSFSSNDIRLGRNSELGRDCRLIPI